MGRLSKFFGIMFSEWGTGLSGPASIPFAIFALFVVGATQKFAYGLLAIILGFFSAYRVWMKENDQTEAARSELENIKKKYFDGRPQLSFQAHSDVGPKAWEENPSPVTFTIHHLSGRVPTSIYFDPVFSKNGNFSLQFESLPHISSTPGFEGVGFEVNEIGVPPLTAANRETIHRYGKIMLRDRFLADNPPELVELDYELKVHFKDKEDVWDQSFNLIFDKARFRFLIGTAPKPQ